MYAYFVVYYAEINYSISKTLIEERIIYTKQRHIPLEVPRRVLMFFNIIGTQGGSLDCFQSHERRWTCLSCASWTRLNLALVEGGS